MQTKGRFFIAPGVYLYKTGIRWWVGMNEGVDYYTYLTPAHLPPGEKDETKYVIDSSGR